MSQLTSTSPQLLKCELTLQHILIRVRLGADTANVCELEIPLNDEQLAYHLNAVFERDGDEHQLALLFVLRQWSSVLKDLTSKYTQFHYEDCVRLTRAMLNWLKDFRPAWDRFVVEKKYESQDYTQLCDNLMWLIAQYSEEPEDIWRFIRQITQDSAQDKSSLFGRNIEEVVWSVMCRGKKYSSGKKKKGAEARKLSQQEALDENDHSQESHYQYRTIKEKLFENEKDYNEVIIWLRQRLSFVKAYTLIRAQQKYWKKIRRESNKLVHRSRRVRGQLEERRLILRASHIDPHNRKVRKRASKLHIRQTEEREKSRIGAAFRTILWPLLTIVGFICIVLIYAVPRLITILKAVQVPDANLQIVLFHSQAFSQLFFLIVYGIVLAYILFKSLTQPLMPEPLRTLLALTFFNTAIPLVATNVWVTVINLSDTWLTFGIVFSIILIWIFTFRDVYRRVHLKVANTEEALKRTLLALCLVIGQELLYMIMLSDLIGRSLLSGPHPQINAQQLMNDYTWGIVPKLIIVPVANYFGIHLFPSVMLLSCFSVIALGTLQERVFTSLRGLSVQE